jgi:hypothetical protein
MTAAILPNSIDRHGLAALIVLFQPAEAASHIKYGSTQDVIEHLVANDRNINTKAIAKFVREARDASFYVVNNAVCQSNSGLKSTADTLYIPESETSFITIRARSVFLARYVAKRRTLTLDYHDGENHCQVSLVTTPSPFTVMEKLRKKHKTLGPIIDRMGDCKYKLQAIGDPDDTRETEDWLFAFDSTDTTNHKVSRTLGDAGFERQHYLIWSCGELVARKSKPRAGDDNLVAEVWADPSHCLFVCNDLHIAKAITDANDFINFIGNGTKEGRYAITSLHIDDCFRFDLAADFDPYFLETSSEAETVQCDASAPLTVQTPAPIMGIPALMRFAFDLLEADPFLYPNHRENARAVMAFAHGVHNHQTLRCCSERFAVEHGIAYEDGVLTVQYREFSREDATVTATLYGNCLALNKDVVREDSLQITIELLP